MEGAPLWMQQPSEEKGVAPDVAFGRALLSGVLRGDFLTNMTDQTLSKGRSVDLGDNDDPETRLKRIQMIRNSLYDDEYDY
jgi:hypothetical protein